MFYRSPSFFLLGASTNLGEPIISSLSRSYPDSPIAILVPHATADDEVLRAISPKQIRILNGDLNNIDAVASAVKESDITINLLHHENASENMRAAFEGLRWRNATEGGIGRGWGNLVFSGGGDGLVDLGYPYSETGIVGNEIARGLSVYDLSSLPFNHHIFQHPEVLFAPSQIGYAVKTGLYGYMGLGDSLISGTARPVSMTDEVVQHCMRVIGWIAQPYAVVAGGASTPLVQVRDNSGITLEREIFDRSGAAAAAVVSEGKIVGVQGERRLWPFGWRRREAEKIVPEGCYHHGKWISGSRL